MAVSFFLFLGLAAVPAGAAVFQAGEGTKAVKAPRAPVIEVGEPFPPLVLPRLSDGKPESITRYRGRKVLVHVFASW